MSGAQDSPVNYSSSPNNLLLILTIHFGFALVGVVTTLLGVVLPALSARLALTDAHGGGLFTVQFAGSLAGTFLSERASRRFGFLPTLSAGLLLMAIALCGFGWLGWAGVVVSVWLNGCGLGITIPTANLLVARMSGERQAAARLNILNFAWGVGAAVSPSLVAALGNAQDVRLSLAVFSALLLATALALLFFLRTAAATLPTATAASEKIVSGRLLWRTRFAVLTAILFFFYVGTENSLGGWLTAYSLRLPDSQTRLWTLTTVFWTAFLLGRLFAPLFLRFFSKQIFILICLAIAAVGTLPLLTSLPLGVIVSGTMLAGFGLAPIFPTALAQFTERFGEAGTQQAKWLFVFSTLGGATLTWLVGVLSTAYGDLRSGLSAALISCLVMIALQWLIARESRE